METQLGAKKGFFVLFGLGLMLMLLLACTTAEETLSSTGGPVSGGNNGVSAVSPVENAVQALAEQRGRSFGAAAAFDASGATRQGILVNGSGQITAVPDQAILNLSVQSLADTVAEAREQSAVAMGRVTEALKARNIEDRDIQTSNFNIFPRYTSREVTRCPSIRDTAEREIINSSPPIISALPSIEPGIEINQRPSIEPSVEISRSQEKPECYKEREQVILGYQVTNQITVKLRNLDAAGSVIDEVTAAGGDLIRFGGINFTIDDTEVLRDQARAAAISDMMDKANQVATLTGVELGRLINISETGGQPRVSFDNLERVSFSAAKAAPTPIMAGELEVTVTVQALYAIK
jgi:uncharacterized protein YggE